MFCLEVERSQPELQVLGLVCFKTMPEQDMRLKFTCLTKEAKACLKELSAR